MGLLRSSLTDSARVVRRVASGPRVEGQTPMTDEPGEWMLARLVPGASSERADDGGVRVVVERAHVIFEGAPEIFPSDRLEVRSAMLGDGTWDVTGMPERAAHPRRVLGSIVPVERTVEPEREDAA